MESELAVDIEDGDASASVRSIAMPALPVRLGASTTSKMRRVPATIAGSRAI
jgi:hypothetical protein